MPAPPSSTGNVKHQVRYPYGSEAAAVLALLNALSAKRPSLPDSVQELLRSPELRSAAVDFAESAKMPWLYTKRRYGLEASQALAQACANLLITTGHVGKPTMA